jgi:hypothetical protein
MREWRDARCKKGDIMSCGEPREVAQARAWAASRSTDIRAFVVCCNRIDESYIQGEHGSFEAACAAARRLGRDRLGRNPTVAVLTSEGWVRRIAVIEVD